MLYLHCRTWKVSMTYSVTQGAVRWKSAVCRETDRSSVPEVRYDQRVLGPRSAVTPVEREDLSSITRWSRVVDHGGWLLYLTGKTALITSTRHQVARWRKYSGILLVIVSYKFKNLKSCYSIFNKSLGSFIENNLIVVLVISLLVPYN